MENYDKKLKTLKECFISHAEIEYLWDPMGKDTGFIDPNALSAGGFPFVFRTILEQLPAGEDKISLENILFIGETLKATFQILGKNEVDELAHILTNTLEEMGITRSQGILNFCEALLKKGSLLGQLYKNSFLSRLKILFSTPFGIAWVLPELWKTYRVNKIREFKQLASQQKGISFMPKQVIAQVSEYMEAFVTTLGKISGSTYTTYDVEWESDMSYYVAEALEQKGISVRVFSDLHSNTGLFSEIPLKALLAPYGNTNYMEVYRLLLHPDKQEITSKRIRFENAHAVLDATAERKELRIGRKQRIDLTGLVFLTKETETELFKQYAYLWEHFDKKQFNKKNESHRKMYLSSLLNAKSAFFEILGKQEKEDNMKIARPKTIVFARETPFVLYEGLSSWVTVKEGGWCSTGGKQVHKKELDEVQGFLEEVNYTGIVVQNYIPSILFYQQGISLHGHIRKASVVKRNGDVVHAGYVLKLIAQEKGNSSGYKSHMMYFDESGTFIFGKEIGGAGELYTRLIDVNLVTAVDLPLVFSQVKYEWLKAMYAVNKFIQQEKIEDFALKMVKSGKISERYLINNK